MSESLFVCLSTGALGVDVREGEYMNKFLRGMLHECSRYMSARSTWHQPFPFAHYTYIRIHICTNHLESLEGRPVNASLGCGGDGSSIKIRLPCGAFWAK